MAKGATGPGRTMIEITEVRVTLFEDPRLKGYASIVLDGQFVVRGIKIIGGKKGRLFVAMGALVASSMTNLSVPYILQKVVDKATTFRPSELDTARPGPFGNMTFHSFLLSVVGFFAAGATASFLRVYSLDMVQMNISRRLRSRLVGNVLHQDMEFFDEHKNVSATTLVHLANDVETVANLVTEKTARLLRGLNSTLGGTCMLLYISPKLTLCLLYTSDAADD